MKKPKIISIINQKGGIMKTTLALTLSQSLATKNFSVLMVDMDAQRNLTLYSGVSDKSKNIFGLLTGAVENIFEAIENVDENLDLIVGSSDMKKWGSYASTIKFSELRLQKILNKVKSEYDFVIIDNPPALDDATINSMVASDYIIVPTEAKRGSVAGILEMKTDYDEVRDFYNKEELKVLGIIPTKIEKGAFNSIKKLSAREQIKNIHEVASDLETIVFDIFLSNNKDYELVAEKNKNFFTDDVESVPKKEINKLSTLILDRIDELEED